MQNKVLLFAVAALILCGTSGAAWFDTNYLGRVNDNATIYYLGTDSYRNWACGNFTFTSSTVFTNCSYGKVTINTSTEKATEWIVIQDGSAGANKYCHACFYINASSGAANSTYAQYNTTNVRFYFANNSAVSINASAEIYPYGSAYGYNGWQEPNFAPTAWSLDSSGMITGGIYTLEGNGIMQMNITGLTDYRNYYAAQTFGNDRTINIRAKIVTNNSNLGAITSYWRDSASTRRGFNLLNNSVHYGHPDQTTSIANSAYTATNAWADWRYVCEDNCTTFYVFKNGQLVTSATNGTATLASLGSIRFGNDFDGVWGVGTGVYDIDYFYYSLDLAQPPLTLVQDSIEVIDYGNVSISAPANITYYRNSSAETILLNYTANTTGTLDCNLTLDGVVINSSTTNNATVSYPHYANISGVLLNHNLTVACNFTNTAQYFQVFAGLNVSVVDWGNLTYQQGYSINLTNSTSYLYNASAGSPWYVNFSQLPLPNVTGFVNLTGRADANASAYYVDEWATTSLQVKIPKYQTFRLNNSYNSTLVMNWSANFSNYSYSSGYFTSNATTGILSIPHDYLPYESIASAYVVSTGYNATWFTNFSEVNGTSAFVNYTFLIYPASLVLRAYDEDTSANISCFNISVVNDTATYSASCLNNTAILLYSALPSGNVTVTVSATGYYSRNYYVYLSYLTAVSLDARLLSSSSTTLFVRIHTITGTQIPISNATISVQRNINNTYVTVAQGITDASGVTAFYLNYLVSYRFVASHASYSTVEQTVTPTSSDYYLTMGSSSTYNFTGGAAIQYYLLPELHYLGYQTNTNITFAIQSNDGELEYFGLNITYYNGTSLWSQAVTGSPSGGLIYLSINGTGKPQGVWVVPYWKSSRYNYTVLYPYLFHTYNFSYPANFSGALEIIRAGTYTSDNTPHWGLGMVSLFLTMIASAFVSRFTLVGGGIFAATLLGLFTFLGWLPLGVFILTCAVTAAVIFMQWK